MRGFGISGLPGKNRSKRNETQMVNNPSTIGMDVRNAVIEV
jgi:hypothetical protein